MIYHGDCLEVLKSLPTHSVDAIVTDPPAGVSFMGRDWDNPNTWALTAHPGKRLTGSGNETGANGFGGGVRVELRDAFITFLMEVFTEARRVLKPGGHALVWSLPRTSHWTAMALENAGFEVRDCINHIFGSGMPKSHNISKAIDKLSGAERRVIGTQHVKDIRRNVKADRAAGITHGQGKFVTGAAGAPIQYIEHAITEPATEQARRYEGYGTGLKPAHELWWLVRSPIEENTIAENVLKYGTGALNIDAARVSGIPWEGHDATGFAEKKFFTSGPAPVIHKEPHKLGRWPANLLLSHTIFCKPIGTKEIKANGAEGGAKQSKDPGQVYYIGDHRTGITYNVNGKEVIQDYDCVEGCPVAELNQQSGISNRVDTRERKAGNISIWGTENAFTSAIHNDTGGASRYFQNFYYCAKPSVKERNMGCEELPEEKGFDKNTSKIIRRLDPDTGNITYSDYTPSVRKNNHPTIKSIQLMSYLIKMITPPGGIVLDPFGGSGTTALACIQEGYDYVLIEREKEYIDIINARVAFMENKYGLKSQQIKED